MELDEDFIFITLEISDGNIAICRILLIPVKLFDDVLREIAIKNQRNLYHKFSKIFILDT